MNDQKQVEVIRCQGIKNGVRCGNILCVRTENMFVFRQKGRRVEIFFHSQPYIHIFCEKCGLKTKL